MSLENLFKRLKSDKDYLEKIKTKKTNDLMNLGIDIGMSHGRGKATANLFELVNFICLEAVDFGSTIHNTQECIRGHASILRQQPHEYWIDTCESSRECIKLCQNGKWRETFFRAALAFSEAYADWLDIRELRSSADWKVKAALVNLDLSWHTYHRHWLNSFWGELDSNIVDFITAYTHITPAYCEYMPEGSSFYVFPEAKKK